VHTGGHEDPSVLDANADISYIGCDIKGQGFLFDDDDADATSIEEMNRVLANDSRSAELVIPYMSGEDINEDARHAHTRWVIAFDEMSEDDARSYPELFDIVERKVKSERATKAKELREWPFWIFWRRRQEMRTAVRHLERMIVLSRVGNHLAFTFLSPTVIVSEAVVVFASDSHELFGVLQSRVHDIWTRLFASSLKDDVRYTPTDCFDPFPRPLSGEQGIAISTAAESYWRTRARIMEDSGLGLTKTYNRFHDPHEKSSEIVQLRDLHAAMDRVVLEAYGWEDEEEDDENESGPSSGSGRKSKKKKPWRLRWPDEFRDEVLARLLELNEQRHQEELLAGKLADKEKKNYKPKTKLATKKAQTDNPQTELF